MKLKSLSVLLLSFVILLIAACGNSKGSGNAADASPGAAATSAASAASPAPKNKQEEKVLRVGTSGRSALNKLDKDRQRERQVAGSREAALRYLDDISAK